MEIKILPIIAVILLIAFGYVFMENPNTFTVTVDYLQSNDCQIADLQLATVKCVEGGYSQITFNDDNSDHIDVESADGKLLIVNSWCEGACSGTVALTEDGVGTICGLPGFPSCNNLEVSSSPTTYTLSKSWLGTNYITFKYQEKHLEYTDWKVPGGAKIPGTEGCIDQSSSLIIQKINDIPDVPSSFIGSDDTSSHTIQWMDIGDTYNFAAGYTPGIPVKMYEYNNLPVKCNFANKNVYYLERLNTLDNSCWIAEGDIAKSNIECCDTYQCQQNYGTDYVCNKEFECEKGGISGTQCSSDAICQPSSPYITTESGTELREYFCNNGHCDSDFLTYVGCDPKITYPDNKVCLCEGSGEDTVCSREDRATRTKDCTQTFGVDACCLSTQTQYTLKEAPEGKECCYVKDGIGKIRDECNPYAGGFSNFFEDFGKGLLESFGFNAGDISDTVGYVFGMLLVAGLIIFIIWLISFMFKTGRGPIQGGISSGQPIIIVGGNR